MASYHAKVMDDGIMKLTIHDCKASIQLHNDLNNKLQVVESLIKLRELSSGINSLIEFIEVNYNKTTGFITNDDMLEAAYLAGYEPSEAVTTADEEIAEAMEYLTNQDVRL